MWRVPREWPGETAFVVAGGPSVGEIDPAVLHGRRVIVVNSSYQWAPFADVLFFGDHRWWGVHRPKIKFAGRIVTCALNAAGRELHRLYRLDVRHVLSLDPASLVLGRTSLHAAINLAFLFGATRIVLLGADMQPAPDGRTHHHEPHPWPLRPNCWDEHIEHLGLLAGPLASRGVEVLNASPVSRLPWWPKVRLEECL